MEKKSPKLDGVTDFPEFSVKMPSFDDIISPLSEGGLKAGELSIFVGKVSLRKNRFSPIEIQMAVEMGYNFINFNVEG